MPIPAHVVTYAPQFVTPQVVKRPTPPQIPSRAPLIHIPTSQTQTQPKPKPPQPFPRHNTQKTFSVPPRTLPQYNSTRLRPTLQTSLRYPHSFQNTPPSFARRDNTGVDHFRRLGPKFSGRPTDDGEEYLLRLYEYCACTVPQPAPKSPHHTPPDPKTPQAAPQPLMALQIINPLPTNPPQDTPAAPRIQSTTLRCYNCRQQGHVYRECPQRRGNFCRVCGLVAQ